MNGLPDNVEDAYPLTPMQLGMVYHSLMEPESGGYLEQFHCRLEGEFEPEAFQAAWKEVYALHGALRAIYLWEGLDDPIQVVRREVSLPWSIEDWSDRPPPARAEAFAAFLRDDRQQALDLTHAPVARFFLIRVGRQQWQFVWTFFHATLDGWSLIRVLRDVFRVYVAKVKGEDSRLAAPEPFSEFVRWLLERETTRASDYWRRALSPLVESCRPMLQVSGANTDPAQNRRTGRHELTLSPEATDLLETFARKNRLTLNSVLHGAWALLLHRYSGSTDVLFGSVVSGRPPELHGLDDMVGCFLNTLPFQTRIQTGMSLLEWLKQLQHQHLEMREFEQSGLMDISRWAGLQGQVHSWLQTALVFENLAEFPAEFPGLNLRLVSPGLEEESSFPLALQVLPEKTGLRLLLNYSHADYSSQCASQITTCLAEILGKFYAHPDWDLSRLLDSEFADSSSQLADGLPLDSAPGPADLVTELLQDNFRQCTDMLAVVFGGDGGRLTYGQLRDRSLQLAARLRALNPKTGAFVGLCVEPSLDMAVGITGILLAGCAYVPLDPAYPDDRLEFILGDTAVLCLVTQRRWEARFARWRCLLLEPGDPGTTTTVDPMPPDPDRAAYVIHTSGSTGRPKGVTVSHRNLAHSLAARRQYYSSLPTRFLLLSSFSFDSSVAGLFWTLCSGGTLIIAPSGLEQDMDELGLLIQRESVTHTLCLPSLYDLLLEYAPAGSLHSLECAIVAGEPCHATTLQQHFKQLPDCLLFNEYGPTEATVWATAWQAAPGDAGKPVPIGRPIPGYRVRVVDAAGRPSPIGVVGEIQIGGDGVTAGYLGLPDLTAQRFIEAEGDGQHSVRYYRTGDRGCWRSDGNLLFLGRTDQQVKIRGHRIELGEIESAALKHPLTAQCAVLLVPPPEAKDTKGKVLGLFVCSNAPGSLSETALRSHLRSLLPAHAVPERIHLVDALPRLPNGKLDAEALVRHAAIPVARNKTEGLKGPEGELQQQLWELYREVLNTTDLGLDDSFFECGGDSLKSIQLISKGRAAGLDLSPADLIEHPTIRLLEQCLQKKQSKSLESLAPEVAGSPIITGENYPLLVPLREKKGKNQVPLYFFHGVGGYVFNFQYIARDLPDHLHPVGVQSPNTDPDRDSLMSDFEAIASLTLRAILTDNPDGPYLFLGYSTGGLLAWDLAKRLRVDGRKEDLLVLLDTYTGFEEVCLPSWKMRLYRRIRFHVTKMLHGPGRLVHLRRFAGRSVETLRIRFSQHAAADYEKRVNRIRRANHRAFAKYRPDPLPGAVVLYRSTVDSYLKIPSKTMGWEKLAAGGVEVIEVPVTHTEMTDCNPSIKLIVRDLAQRTARYEMPPP